MRHEKKNIKQLIKQNNMRYVSIDDKEDMNKKTVKLWLKMIKFLFKYIVITKKLTR